MTVRSRATLLATAAALALVLVVADFVVAEFNRSAQLQVNQRQQFINQGIEVGRVNQMLVHALAAAAVRNNDPQLQALLAKQGITINAAPTGAATPVPSPTAAVRGAVGVHQP